MTKNAAWPEGSFLDSLATGVLATDPKGKIVYANAASEILSGASKNRLLGISAEAVFPSARRWTERFLSDTVRGEPTLTERTEMFCPRHPTEGPCDGQPFPGNRRHSDGSVGSWSRADRGE